MERVTERKSKRAARRPAQRGASARSDAKNGAPFQLERWIDPRRRLVEAGLAAALASLGAPEPLAEAVRYAALSPGKRLRPVLVLAAAEAVADPKTQREDLYGAALPLACAGEMIHAYSLVHDDLPAMDDDDLRRGRPTTHVAFDEATAILAGDALLTEAFRLAAGAPGLPRQRRGDAVCVLAECAGAAGMVGGQMLDLVAEGRFRTRLGAPAVDLPKLERLASWKTGALISAAAGLGGIAGGAGDATVRALREYGRKVGLAFQIVDDLLDEESSSDVLGKATGKDAARGKVTFPQLLGAKAARKRAEELRGEAVAIVRRFRNAGGAALAAIAEWAVRRTK